MCVMKHAEEALLRLFKLEDYPLLDDEAAAA